MEKSEINDNQIASNQKRMLKVIREINKNLLSGISYQKILDLAFDTLGSVIPYDRIGIAFLTGVGPEARATLKWVRSKVPVANLGVNYSESILNSSLQKILDSGKPRIIDDLVEHCAKYGNSQSTQLIIQDGIRSSLTCPLRSQGESVGFIFFSSCQTLTYDKNHLEIFQDVADELALIVSLGRLQQDFNSSNEQTKSMAMILHDLKSPLSTIQGFAENSLEEPWFEKIDPEVKSIFKIFLRNSKYMFNLLSELNEIGELNQNPDHIDLQPVALKPFCEKMKSIGMLYAEAKQIEFIYSFSEQNPVSAQLDPHKIRRILENLFSNAVKYSHVGSQISFSVKYAVGRLTFSVSDTGLGIPANEFSKLFQLFGKTSVQPTNGESSTGIGLYIFKKLVQQHQGEVLVESEVGKGSVFSFWIPC